MSSRLVLYAEPGQGGSHSTGTIVIYMYQTGFIKL